MNNNMEKCREKVEERAALITALAPVIGYDKATRVFQRARKEGKSIRQLICEDPLLSTEQLDTILNHPALAAG